MATTATTTIFLGCDSIEINLVLFENSEKSSSFNNYHKDFITLYCTAFQLLQTGYLRLQRHISCKMFHRKQFIILDVIHWKFQLASHTVIGRQGIQRVLLWQAVLCVGWCPLFLQRPVMPLLLSWIRTNKEKCFAGLNIEIN